MAQIGIVTMVPMGEWNAGTFYQKLNTVRYNGATYIAKKSNQNFEPTVKSGWTEVWQALCYDGQGFNANGTYPNMSVGNDSTGQNIAQQFADIRKEIEDESHFRGVFTSVEQLKNAYPSATSNDYAYVTGGNIWVYQNNEWIDSGESVPNSLVPASDSVPLMDGEATVGMSNNYARGDHRHPSDTFKANTTGIYEDFVAGELYGTEIQINTDLNDLIPDRQRKFGIYVCTTNSTSSTLLNTPYPNMETAFYMQVAKIWTGEGEYKRVAQTLYTKNGAVYTRALDYAGGDSPQWTEWINITEIPSNPNLLINPNFAINQRGQSSYTGTNNQYTVDRWKNVSSVGIVTPLTDGGITLASSSGYAYIIQTYYGDLTDLQLTLSATVNGTKYSKSGKIVNNASWQLRTEQTHFDIYIQQTAVNSKTFNIALRTDTSITIDWVKLEVGSSATEFIPPNIAEELVKCQRYYLDICSNLKSSIFPYAVGSGLCYSTSLAYFVVPIPSTMNQTTAQITIVKDIDKLSILSNGKTLSITALDIVGANNASVTLRATGTFELAQSAILRVSAGENSVGLLAFDAEI